MPPPSKAKHSFVQVCMLCGFGGTQGYRGPVCQDPLGWHLEAAQDTR